MKTAYATIKGFGVMRMFKKGQFAPRIDAIGGGTEARFIHACSAFMCEPGDPMDYATPANLDA